MKNHQGISQFCELSKVDKNFSSSYFVPKEQKWQVCKTAPIEKVMYRHLLIVQCVKFRFSKNATKIRWYLTHEFDVHIIEY